MSPQLTVLFVPAGRPPEIRQIDQSLPAMQELVGGYIDFHTLHVQGYRYSLVVNQNAVSQNLPINRRLADVLILGDFFITHANPQTDEEQSLTPSDINLLRQVLPDIPGLTGL